MKNTFILERKDKFFINGIPAVEGILESMEVLFEDFLEEINITYKIIVTTVNNSWSYVEMFGEGDEKDGTLKRDHYCGPLLVLGVVGLIEQLHLQQISFPVVRIGAFKSNVIDNKTYGIYIKHNK